VQGPLLGGGWELGGVAGVGSVAKERLSGRLSSWNRWGSYCSCSGSIGVGERERTMESLSLHFFFWVCKCLMSHLVGC